MKRTIAFNSLPEDVRQRFVESLSGLGPPPFASEPVEPTSYVLGISALVISLCVNIPFLGEEWLLLSVPPSVFIGSYAVLSMVRAFIADKAPYPRGKYIFPRYFVDASDGTLLRVVFLSDVMRVEIHNNANVVLETEQGSRVNLVPQSAHEAANNIRAHRVSSEGLLDQYVLNPGPIQTSGRLLGATVPGALRWASLSALAISFCSWMLLVSFLQR